MFFIFQNDTVCLPPGLECYKTKVELDNEDCIIPCKGIYADLVRKDIKDIEANSDFRSVYEEYKNYKGGFKKNEGL